MRFLLLLLLCIHFLGARESSVPAKELYIGVLNNRGDDVSLHVWEETASYLSTMLPSYHFTITPLNTTELKEKLKAKTIDFIITNPIQYAQLEYSHHISRIATLGMYYQGKYYAQYGSAVFTRANEPTLQTFKDIHTRPIGAVDGNSFGGFLLVQQRAKIKKTEKITFFKTHDAVVQAVLDKKVDVGIVRTSTLEKLQEQGLLRWDDIRILEEKKHDNFPFHSSTDLYPEWAFAKADHTSDELCDEVLGALIKTALSPSPTQRYKWKTPLDYIKMHTILEELQLYPYEGEPFTFYDVLVKYKYLFLGLFTLFLIITLALMRIKFLNKELLMRTSLIESFNATLEEEVKERTRQLSLVNEKLKEMANTDELTKINNRRHFFQLGQLFFFTAKRTRTELYILSLDIDYFKSINDEYGHAAGDEVLKLFCKTIASLIRESDLFGRIGGEEFCICVQNTSKEGVLILAEKIRSSIESMRCCGNFEKPLRVTLSIGVTAYRPSDNALSDSIKRSDEALYQAKHNGRNQVCFI